MMRFHRKFEKIIRARYRGNQGAYEKSKQKPMKRNKRNNNEVAIENKLNALSPVSGPFSIRLLASRAKTRANKNDGKFIAKN